MQRHSGLKYKSKELLSGLKSSSKLKGWKEAVEIKPKKNIALTMGIGQIEKNPILAMSIGKKEVEKYERVTNAYGNVTPAIVGQNGNAYRMLAGQSSFEACVRTGIKDIPVIIAKMDSEADEMKLALLLSTVRKDGSPLSEGAFIDALVTRHGVTRNELLVLLKKSKSWLSKRQSLVLNLTDEVKEMVKTGVICARTAEEVAKLPRNVQASFASRVAMDGLSKTDAGRLVGLYIQKESSPALQDAIINSPFAVLDACPVAAVSRRKEKRGLPERIAGCAGFIIRLAYELKGLLASADTESIKACTRHLEELCTAIADIRTVLHRINGAVSPGKSEGGSNS